MRCWRAKTDGWAASTFHSNCDGKGPTVTIIQVDSYIFGGFTDVSWSSSEYHFIFRSGFFQFVSLLNVNRWFCFLMIQFFSINAVSRPVVCTTIIISDSVILHGPRLVFTLETGRYSSYCMKITTAIASKQ